MNLENCFVCVVGKVNKNFRILNFLLYMFYGAQTLKFSRIPHVQIKDVENLRDDKLENSYNLQWAPRLILMSNVLSFPTQKLVLLSAL